MPGSLTLAIFKALPSLTGFALQLPDGQTAPGPIPPAAAPAEEGLFGKMPVVHGFGLHSGALAAKLVCKKRFVRTTQTT